MSHELWTAVDGYIVETIAPQDEALRAALTASAAGGLPPINVAPNQGKLLQLLAEVAGARRILEIGTLGGYSTIWLARALPSGGRLVSLELDAHHAEVARSNIARAGLADRVEVRTGPALDSLAALEAEAAEPFDFTFIDADKVTYPRYFAWALKLSRPGAVIVADNMVRSGAIIEAGSDDPMVQGARALYDLIAAEPRVSATGVQTVGSKGYDGFVIARVNG